MTTLLECRCGRPPVVVNNLEHITIMCPALEHEIMVVGPNVMATYLAWNCLATKEKEVKDVQPAHKTS